VAEVQVSVDSDEDSPDPELLELLERAVRAAVTAGAATSPWPVPEDPTVLEVSVHLTGDEQMRELNRIHRGVDRPTDVLSFSFVAEEAGLPAGLPSEVPIPIGDVVLSLPYAQRQSHEIGHSLPTELAWLTIHGTLQLLGFVHDTDDAAASMERIEHKALDALGLS
jgi:probable rRNA maturation factor